MKNFVKYSFLFTVLIVGCKSKKEKIIGEWRCVVANGDSTRTDHGVLIASFGENNIVEFKRKNYDGSYETNSDDEPYWEYVPKSNSILIINNIEKDTMFLTDVSIKDDYLTGLIDGEQFSFKKIISNENQKSADLNNPELKTAKLEKAVLISVKKKFKEDRKESIIKSLQLVQKSDKEYIGIIEFSNGYSVTSSKIEVIGDIDKFVWQIKD